MYTLPGTLAITRLESPVATKLPVEFYQPDSRTTFNEYMPVLPLVPTVIHVWTYGSQISYIFAKITA